nr:cytochrome c biogenesis protein CcdA [Paenibacillus sambharensis]
MSSHCVCSFFSLPIHNAAIRKGGVKLDYLLAFAAGLLSFLSPCILPLIPAYISYIVGSSLPDIQSQRNRISAFMKTVYFVLGFSLLFVLMGLSFSSLSALLTEHLRWLQQAGGVLIIMFGLHMTGVFRMKFLYAERRFTTAGGVRGYAGAFLLGTAFAAGWTPCIGPILSTILIYAGSLGTAGKGAVMLSLYSAGLAVPFLLSSLLLEHVPRILRKMSRFTPVISVFSGVLVILMGILVFTNRLERLGQYSGLFNL